MSELISSKNNSLKGGNNNDDCIDDLKMIIPSHKPNDNNNNNNNNNNDDDDDDDENDTIHIEEHHDLVIQQTMSIGTDDDDDDDVDNNTGNNDSTTIDYYYDSSDTDGSRCCTTTTNGGKKGSFLYHHSTKFWNTTYDSNFEQPPSSQQHLYNYLESTEGFLLNGDNTTVRNSHTNYHHHPRNSSSSNRNFRNSSSSSSSSIITGWRCCIGTMIVFIIISIIAIVVPNNRIARNKTSAGSDSYNGWNSNYNNDTIYILPPLHKFKGAPQYTCPDITNNYNNNDNEDTTIYYDDVFNFRFINKIDLDVIEHDMNEFINTFRNRNIIEYMNVGWIDIASTSNVNITYTTYKEQILVWRTSKYIPFLKKTGANIMELNCGIGVNLFLTYEIIQQDDDNIRDVHLYGTTTTTTTASGSSYNNNEINDYVIRSAITANLLLDTILQKEANYVGGGKRGMICPTKISTGSSSGSSSTTTNHNNNNDHNHILSYYMDDLAFIPDNLFDLVYTGYIPLIRDVWDNSSLTNHEYIQRQIEICHMKDIDWKSATIYDQSQQQQEIIYGQYVAEMIRITKPGNVIAIEHVPYPFCDTYRSRTTTNPTTDELQLLQQYYSGGGILPSFWYSPKIHERYQWYDIDVSSIEIEEDTSLSALYSNDNDNNGNTGSLYNHTHYHVVMRKAKR